eukprot:225133_1
MLIRGCAMDSYQPLCLHLYRPQLIPQHPLPSQPIPLAPLLPQTIPQPLIQPQMNPHLTFAPSSVPTTDNPTTANPTTDEPTIASTSAPNDRTSSMPPTVYQTVSMPPITALPTEQTASDSSTKTTAFLHDLSTPQDSNSNMVLVMIISSVVIVVLLVSLCGCILFLQKKRVKASVEFIAPNPPNDTSKRDPQARHVQSVNVHQTSNGDVNATVIADVQQTKRSDNNYIKREVPVSLEGIGMTAEGDGNIGNDRRDMVSDEDVVNEVNHDEDMTCTRGGGTNDGDANEYQNNANIAEDEFIVRNDEDNAYKLQQHVTKY